MRELVNQLFGFGSVDLIWRWSEKYPGSRPVTGFKRYISLVQFDTDYYYNVYPHSATNDVKAALRVQDALERFAGTSQSLSTAEPPSSTAMWRAF